jgi:hypothetical protein
MPTAMISLLVFAYKSKIAKAHGHDSLNCKHRPNVCKFLLGLEAQNSRQLLSHLVQKDANKNIQHSLRILGFALRSNPSHHLHFIIHPVLFIYAYDVKRVISSDHSSCIYHPFIHQTINLIM